MKSALYRGTVEHRRMKPMGHEFTYAVSYFFLDLDELKQIFRWPLLLTLNTPGILSFWRKDYLGDAKLDLKQAVQLEIEKQLGEKHQGPIRLLTNISYFGHCFNPVSFYYCYDTQERLQYIVAEVTNTPWNERHREVLRFAGDFQQVYTLTKQFHVSPFMPMGIDYTWVMNTPAQELSVLMQNRFAGEKELMFDAHLKMQQLPFTGLNILGIVLRSPLMSFKPLLAIYWQAVKLWFKKAPFHTHPGKAGQQ